MKLPESEVYRLEIRSNNRIAVFDQNYTTMPVGSFMKGDKWRFKEWFHCGEFLDLDELSRLLRVLNGEG